MVYLNTLPIDGFVLAGGAYTTRSGDGTYTFDDGYLELHGAGFDHWRGAISSHKDGSPYIVFAGDDHRDAKAGAGAGSHDIKCERR